MRVAVRDVLDAELPEVYGPELFDRKVDTIFDHIHASYFDNGASVYDTPRRQRRNGAAVATMPTVVEEVNDDLLAHVRSDPELFARLMETVFGATATWACPTEQTPDPRRDASSRVQADRPVERAGAAQGQDDGARRHHDRRRHAPTTGAAPC